MSPKPSKCKTLNSSVNSSPIFTGIVAESRPWIEMIEEEEAQNRNGFVTSCSRKKKAAAPAKIPTTKKQPPPCQHKNRNTVKVNGNPRAEVLVRHLPLDAGEREVRLALNRFGTIQSFCWDEKGQETLTARIAFQSVISAKDAVAFNSVIIIGGNMVHIEHAKVERALNNMDLQSLFSDFLSTENWKYTAAQYLFRNLTMEDYFNEFVHTLACARGVRVENLANLEKKLIALSDTRPDDLDELMPPTISGMVSNMIKDNGKRKHPFCSTLTEAPHLFKIDRRNKKITYLEPIVSKDEAVLRLREILIDGLFIYFFAKFCHGQTFPIKYYYYQKSEPIRSCLLLITGKNDVVNALKSYFKRLRFFFTFNESAMELTLTRDYFSKDLRKFLEPYKDMPPQQATGTKVTKIVPYYKNTVTSPTKSIVGSPMYQSSSIGSHHANEPMLEERSFHEEWSIFNVDGVVESIVNDSATIKFFCRYQTPQGQLLKQNLEHAELKRQYFRGTHLKADDHVKFNAVRDHDDKWIVTSAWQVHTPRVGEVLRGLRGRLNVGGQTVFLTDTNGSTVVAPFSADKFMANRLPVGLDDLAAYDGCEVNLDLIIQGNRQYAADQVWIGPRPENFQVDQLASALEKILEPVEVTQDIRLESYSHSDLNNNSLSSGSNNDYTLGLGMEASDLEADLPLPDTIHSVIMNVLEEGTDYHGHNLITNPIAIDHIMNQILANGFSDLTSRNRKQIKVRLEQKIRDVFMQLLVEHSTNK